MDEQCPDLTTIEDIHSLPGNSPQRKHIEKCPRCRALWKSYQTFMAGNDAPATARVAEAEQKMSDFLTQEIFNSADQTTQGTTPKTILRIKPWWQRSARSAPRTGLLTAAVLVAVIGLSTFLSQNNSQINEVRQRGENNYPQQTYPAGTVMVSETGLMTLTWSKMSDVKTYQVVLFNIDLDEFHRLKPVPETKTALAPEILDKQTDPVFWTVIGLADDRELARTRMSALIKE